MLGLRKKKNNNPKEKGCIILSDKHFMAVFYFLSEAAAKYLAVVLAWLNENNMNTTCPSNCTHFMLRHRPGVHL